MVLIAANRAMRWPLILSIFVMALSLPGCNFFPEPSLLAKIKSDGEIIVITRPGSTTYYQGPDGQPAGLEYELAKRFADRLGVKLKIVVPPFFSDTIPMVARGDAHFAAAGLSVTEERQKVVRFGPSYQQITQQLIYRYGNIRPKSVADIIDGDIEVVSGSSHVEQLVKLQQHYPALRWRENSELESEGLLTFVWDRMIDYTVADSNEVALSQRFYPELRVAFDINKPEPIAWAFPIGDDDTLYNEAVLFFAALLDSGELEQLLERYYGHTKTFDYVGTRKFKTHYYQRLVTYQALFEEAAEKNGLDWRLLAAMSYQESHWNPKAISPTGVRGLMMLTLTTARQLGIRNRIDPKQSIDGGARYLKSLIKRVPKRIQEPDRTWMAIAAYNVGFGHLRDARTITQRRGFDPDKWMDVKESLPLLRQKKWYQKTRYGYARGHEPVMYVRNIRNYYDLVRRISDEKKSERSKERHEGSITTFPRAI